MAWRVASRSNASRLGSDRTALPVRQAARAAAEHLEARRLFAADFTLQLLHASDFEAGLPAIQDAPRFAAVLDALEETFPNTVRLSSGDNYLPGPFFNAGGDPALNPVLGGAGAASIGRADIEILNRLGIQASTIGNHEFDAGPREFRNIFAAAGTWRGAQFPYLSSNLNFATDPDLSAASVNAGPGQEASAVRGKLTKSTVITVNGQRIGVVGATTPQLESISSTGGVGVLPANDNDMAALAAIVQPEVDALVATGINKVVVATHLQQLSFERQLAPLLRNVDVLIGGGSNTQLADSNDRLRSGDAHQGNYPEIFTNATGDPLALINTDGNFKYVGRLIARFDAAGRLVDFDESGGTPFFNPAENGAYAADDAGVLALYPSLAAAFAPGTKGAAVKEVTDAVAAVIAAKDSQLFGQTDVYLEGRRINVRTQETNLGNLTNDANLSEAKDTDPTVTVSIKNGGGIRDSIGSVAEDGTPQPPAANPSVGKQAGDVSQLDVENSLRFNNQLSVVALPATGLKSVLEHAVAAVAPGATPGQFPQVGGIRFSFDAARPAQVIAGNAGTGTATITQAGQRIRNAVVVDGAGNIVDVLVRDGALVGDPNRVIKVVTLNFLADDPDNDGRGGDNYPFPTFDQSTTPLNIGEQAALAEFLQETYPVAGSRAFNEPETAPAQDRRIQNLAARSDGVIVAPAVQFSAATYTVTEGQPTVTVAVNRTGDLTQPTTVNFATSNGTATAGQDYTATSGVLTFAPGQTTQTFTVAITDDPAFELFPNETINLTLSTPIGSNSPAIVSPSTATIQIVDNEPRALVVSDATVVEGGAGSTATARFEVRLAARSGQTVTVNYGTSDGAATEGSDYAAVDGTLTFAPGETLKVVEVTVRGDSAYEPGEFFLLNLFAPTNATLADAQGRGRILNDDAAPTLSVNNVTLSEGNSGLKAFVFTVRLSKASASPVTVGYATNGITARFGSDYVGKSGTLTFAAGQTSRTVTVLVRGDRTREAAERFGLSLFSAAGATIADALGVGTILNDD